MRANIPKGMGGGPQNMQAMIRQAQKMQEDMAALQEDLDAREYEIKAGGGVVGVKINGKKRDTVYRHSARDSRSRRYRNTVGYSRSGSQRGDKESRDRQRRGDGQGNKGLEYARNVLIWLNISSRSKNLRSSSEDFRV
jgi:hypothetical protein